jgi:hypothetical protein
VRGGDRDETIRGVIDLMSAHSDPGFLQRDMVEFLQDLKRSGGGRLDGAAQVIVTHDS